MKLCDKPLYVTQRIAQQTATWLGKRDGLRRIVEPCRECGGYHIKGEKWKSRKE